MARRQKKVRARKRTGIAGAPTDGTFRWFLRYLHYDVDSKEYAEVVKNYVKKNYKKEYAKAILAVPAYEYANSHTAGICYWASLENEFDTGYEDAMKWLKKKFKTLKAQGSKILKTKVVKTNKFVVTPLMRQQAHIFNTIMEDLYQIEENWSLGTKFDLYKKLQIYDIKRFVEVESWINEHLVDYKQVIDKDAYMIESYAHIPLKEIKSRVEILERFENEVTNMKVSKKAIRKVPRAKTRKGADKQILKLKYQKDSSEFQLTSINPMHIPGAMTLHVFNTKYRQLTVYVSDNPDGLLVSGSTVKGFDQVLSQVMTLRKPGVIIPEIMKKTPKQVTKLIDDLAVAKKVPTGRINANTIILKAK